MIPRKDNKTQIPEDDSSTSVVSFGEDPLKITSTIDNRQTSTIDNNKLQQLIINKLQQQMIINKPH